MNRRNVIWLGVGATASGATAHFPQFALAQEECSGDVPGLNSIRAYGSYPEARAELLERAWKNTQAGYNVVEDSPDKIVVAWLDETSGDTLLIAHEVVGPRLGSFFTTTATMRLSKEDIRGLIALPRTQSDDSAQP